MAWLTFWLFVACSTGRPAGDSGGSGGSIGAGAGGRGGTSSSGGGTATGGSGSGGILVMGGDSAGDSGKGGGGSASSSGGTVTGGATGSGGAMDGGSTDTGGSGGCGDPAVKALFAACKATQDEASCTEQGGHWRMFEGGTPGGACVCPTGEGGCPCAASSDCLGFCTAWLDPFDSSSCNRVTSFTCTSTYVAERGGCWCRPETPTMAVCYP